jgi:uncharacterized protein YyaL (SSP411 family)
MDQKHSYTNRLINENSPYLLQHAHNPVDWFPWGNEALEKARSEDKLLLISIGYSACHWCHVMEHESFENEEIAEIMNANFVCVKIDREEHPNVDQVYMTAVQIMTGSGGWPLNCFALPDGRPVYGGTYFRPEQWKHILIALSSEYKTEKDKFIRSAESIENGIRRSEFGFTEISDNILNFEALTLAVDRIKNQFDTEDGGFNRAPKFPLPSFWNFLLEYAYYSNDPDIKSQLILTLDKMAYGGIYDQIGGGFARYSVDSFWKVPHFEKMLYDNAQLISLYSRAYQYTKRPLYKKIVEQTIEFTERELTSPESMIYASYDADSEGKEGKYYVWTKQEIDAITGADSELYGDYYNISEEGNWEDGTNILFTDGMTDELAAKYKQSAEELHARIEDADKKLLESRSKRIMPGLDDKILLSWNAMMISAFTEAYMVFDRISYLKSAETITEFIYEHMFDENLGLYRTYKDKTSKISAFLDDYAFYIEANLKLYRINGKEHFLNQAKSLTEYCLDHFYDTDTGMFFYVSDTDFELIVRQKEISDNVIPSSNSVMAKNLHMLGIMSGDTKYRDIAENMLRRVFKDMLNNIDYFGNWASLALKFMKDQYELVIVGDKHSEYRQQILTAFRPDVLFAGTSEDTDFPLFANRLQKDKTQIYVCRNNVCDLPVYEPEKAKEMLESG